MSIVKRFSNFSMTPPVILQHVVYLCFYTVFYVLMLNKEFIIVT